MSEPAPKIRIRWRHVSDGSDWACWEANGERLIVGGKSRPDLDEEARIISIVTRKRKARK